MSKNIEDDDDYGVERVVVKKVQEEVKKEAAQAPQVS